MAEQQTNERLLSLDALRGFDMFWLMAGGGMIRTLAKATDWPWLQALKAQIVHPPWHGFTAWDMIFPLFQSHWHECHYHLSGHENDQFQTYQSFSIQGCCRLVWLL